jgi:hypothetical protein
MFALFRAHPKVSRPLGRMRGESDWNTNSGIISPPHVSVTQNDLHSSQVQRHVCGKYRRGKGKKDPDYSVMSSEYFFKTSLILIKINLGCFPRSMILLWKLRIMRSWNTVSPIHATHNDSTQLISAQIDCWLFGGNCVGDPR